MNAERGDGAHELVPRIIGMSIPHRTNLRMWAIFALSHFKPFSICTELLAQDEDPIVACTAYEFLAGSSNVMTNWEAIHECKDE